MNDKINFVFMKAHKLLFFLGRGFLVINVKWNSSAVNLGPSCRASNLDSCVMEGNEALARYRSKTAERPTITYKMHPKLRTTSNCIYWWLQVAVGCQVKDLDWS